MKNVSVLFKNIVKKIKKHFEKKDFLNSKPEDVIKDLEVNTAYKVRNLRCTIRELLRLKEYDLLRMMQHQRHLENLFIFLQKEIKKRDLDIDLKKYPAFKNFELKRKDKAEYIKENLIN